MTNGRLRSSFIYLANAVNDLRGNWSALALVLAPLVLTASLCLLPDALNLQYRLARGFGRQGHTVSIMAVQTPYVPQPRAAARLEQPYPAWLTYLLYVLFFAMTIAVHLTVLCALRRIQAGTRKSGALSEAVEIYRHALGLAPAFLWVWLLHGLAIVVGAVLLVAPALLAYVWIYFAEYALVFDDRHSWLALLHSRALVRGRFFKVATRIVVFLAVWSGYNSWAYLTFGVVSWFLGPVGVITGWVASTIFVLDLLAVGVTYATTAFFLAAGVRLYQDLSTIAADSRVEEAALRPTVEFGSASGS